MAHQSKKALYLGLDPSRYQSELQLDHFPIITIKQVSDKELTKFFDQMESYTHVICSSRTAASLLFQKNFPKNKCFVAIGKATAQLLKEHGVKELIVAKEEIAEGLITILKEIAQPHYFFFYPHSAGSRPVIQTFLNEQNINHLSCILYHTIINPDFPFPDLVQYSKIIFTSPSTVDAFLKVYGYLPIDKELFSIGSVTTNYLLGKMPS